MTPQNWTAVIKPQLARFLSLPIIKELIDKGDAPAQPNTDTSPNLDLQKIQESLQQLSKAVEALKKAPTHPPPSKDANANKSKQKPSTPHKPPTLSWSDHRVRSSWGSWGLGISDKITKMDFREGSFPKGKLVT